MVTLTDITGTYAMLKAGLGSWSDSEAMVCWGNPARDKRVNNNPLLYFIHTTCTQDTSILHAGLS